MSAHIKGKGKKKDSTNKKKKVTALVLQGGGALGAYEYGVVKALYENSNFKPDIVCGVSIGGFSAAVIAGAKEGPVNGLTKLWDMFTASNIPFMPHDMQVLMTIPYNSGMYRPNYGSVINPLSTTHLFDTSPLYRTLNEIIDFDKLNHKTAPEIVITATNIETGTSEQFNNREMKITPAHVMASGSLPPSFPMVAIGDYHYWDGGLFSNTPLKPALKCLERLAEDADETEIIMVELFPQKGDTPENMNDVIERLGSLIFQSKISFDQKLFDRTQRNIEFIKTLDEELPKNSHLREAPAFKQLMGYSKVDKLTVIKYKGEENMLGISDFTEKTITRRISQGYQDGLAHLNTHSA